MSDLLTSAIELMILGMGFVYLFLTILVFATSYMSKLILRYAPEPESAPSASKMIQSAPQSASPNDPQLLAVLSAAVDKYRSDQKK